MWHSVKMQVEVIVMEDAVVLAIVMLVREMRLRPMLRAVRLVQLEVLQLRRRPQDRTVREVCRMVVVLDKLLIANRVKFYRVQGL